MTTRMTQGDRTKGILRRSREPGLGLADFGDLSAGLLTWPSLARYPKTRQSPGVRAIGKSVEKSVSTKPGVGITWRASHNPGRRGVDGKHRGDNVWTGPAATVRRPGRGGPDRGRARRSHRPPRRVGRGGLRG